MLCYDCLEAKCNYYYEEYYRVLSGWGRLETALREIINGPDDMDVRKHAKMALGLLPVGIGYPGKSLEND